MRILYIGESWLGSCARSLKEALARRADVELDEINEDAFFPKPRSRCLRALLRATAPAYRREFDAEVLRKVEVLRPDVVIAYKGHPVHGPLLEAIRQRGGLTVNIYPDCSPHRHGEAHRKAVGTYDLVISTKSYHPGLWATVYGYANRCMFVPQGYDPALHLVEAPSADFTSDVVLVATYRESYGRLMKGLAEALGDSRVTVTIGGHGWESCRGSLPGSWTFRGPLQGRAYVSLLRQGRICIAPLTREAIVNGVSQPGDVDTTRTYELAAAHCFFIHRRTDFARSLYAEDEVPMYDDAADLARLIRHYLARDDDRARMAAAAHRRAVPAYSLDARADEIVGILRHSLATREGARGR